MSIRFFEGIFKNLPIPILICRNAAEYPVVFANFGAQLLLNPNLTVSRLERGGDDYGPLCSLLRFQAAEMLDDIVGTVVSAGSVHNHFALIYDFEEQLTPISISASFAAMPNGEYLVFYLHERRDHHSWTNEDSAELMNLVFQAAYHSTTADNAINKILRITGAYVHVSRAYIFEEISAETTRNTYEWCNAGIAPAIEGLQNLRKEDYNYDAIVNGGIYVTNNIRELPENDFAILDSQGIKSLVILPIYHNDKPLGYVGFDDCHDCRRWSGLEIELLQNISSVLASLIVRRNAEQKAARSLDIMQIISDNMDSIIYANDVETCELVFINAALAKTLGQPAEQMLGKPCWQVLQKEMDGPCDFCPMPRLIDENGNISKGNYLWEAQNSLNHKWYLLSDSIINWVDGRKVHLETGKEITHQKQYEQQLEYFASTDTMTGAYNREWGHKLMREMLTAPQYSYIVRSLIFLDLDGLKHTNDTYGHDVGDDMIISVVTAIRAATRKSDLLFRWGGDEFILLIECSIESAEFIVKNVQKELDVINRTGEKCYRLSFSYGISEFCAGSGMTLDEIVMDADKKMYANKMKKRLDTRH